jgi:hypothetical protein
MVFSTSICDENFLPGLPTFSLLKHVISSLCICIVQFPVHISKVALH